MYDKERRKLTIDFKKGESFPDNLSELGPVERLALVRCPTDLELPAHVAELQDVRYLKLTDADDKRVPVPAVLYELPVERIDCWEVQPEDLFGFKKLRQLEFVIPEGQTTFEQVQRLAQGPFADLEHLEIWGSHLKQGELPPAITGFANVRVLHLVSCGLSDLPEELVQLAHLEELDIRGLPMIAVPEVVGRLSALKRLSYGQRTASLPDSMAALTQLEELNLGSALNKGVMISSWDETKHLRPMPEVLGKLTSLRKLVLDCCGVLDASVLQPLHKLESLSMTWCGLPDLRSLEGLTALKELLLEESGKLGSLDGLKALQAIERLDISETELTDLSPILALPKLRWLKVDGCDEVHDFEPLYTHPTLEELVADDEIEEAYKDKLEAASMPSIESILQQTSSDDLSTAEEGLRLLTRHVHFNSSSKQRTNPLCAIFGLEEPEGGTPLAIPLLDAAMALHGSKLGIDTLVALVKATFQRVDDNFQVTIDLVDELVGRGDIEAQKAVVAQFKQACAYYDACHRYMDGTVQDTFIEALFPKLHGQALLPLVKWCGSDHLNGEYGDDMDSLFVPAFRTAAGDDELEDKLIEVFLPYYEKMRASLQGGYFEGLMNAIESNGASPRVLEELRGAEARGEKVKAAREALEGDDVKAAEAYFLKVGTEITKRDLEELDMAFLRAHRSLPIAADPLAHYWRFLMTTRGGRRPDEVAVLLAKHDVGQLLALARALADELDDKGVAYLVKELKSATIVGHEADLPADALDAMRNLAADLGTDDLESIKKAEAKKLLKRACELLSRGRGDSIEPLAKAIDRAATLGPLPELGAFEGRMSIEMQINKLVRCGEHQKVAEAMPVIRRIPLSDSGKESILRHAIVSAVMLGDEPFIDDCLQMVPDTIDSDLMAYNLACLFATRSDKSNLLKYTRRSLELGKSATQFRDDSDFEAYLGDAEFEAVLASI